MRGSTRLVRCVVVATCMLVPWAGRSAADPDSLVPLDETLERLHAYQQTVHRLAQRIQRDQMRAAQADLQQLGAEWGETEVRAGRTVSSTVHATSSRGRRSCRERT